MKTQEELRKELDRAYAAAEQAGIESWNKLAELVGIPYPTIYRIITNKGKLTEQLLRRVQNELMLKGIVLEGSPITFASNNAQNVSAPVTQTTTTTDDRWFDLVAEKDAQINRLLGIIEKMQE